MFTRGCRSIENVNAKLDRVDYLQCNETQANMIPGVTRAWLPTLYFQDLLYEIFLFLVDD